MRWCRSIGAGVVSRARAARGTARHRRGRRAIHREHHALRRRSHDRARPAPSWSTRRSTTTSAACPRHGIFRDIPVRFDYPTKANYDRVYPIDVISVRASEGTPAEYSVETEGDNERIKIGDPDRTITGEHTVRDHVPGARRAQRVRGPRRALLERRSGTSGRYRSRRRTSTVHAPADITGVNCSQGPFGSYQPCGRRRGGVTPRRSPPRRSPGYALGPYRA